MKHTQPAVVAFRFILTAVLLASGLLCARIPVHAAEAAGTKYIVKYRESAALLMGVDSTEPFDVVSEEAALRLARAGLLEWYEPDGEAELLESESDALLEEAGLMDSPYYGQAQWNLDLVGADATFSRSCLGQGIRVGVVDSGINPHPDLADCLLPGSNYIESTANTGNTTDTYGHGTRVAGLIAGAGIGGYIGTAPGAEVVPLKVTDGQTVKISAICRAIYGGIDDYGCDVLNLSLGAQTEYQALKEAVEYAESRGVSVVAASGNAGTSAFYYPAKYETVIGVGSVDQNGTWYDHSTHNSSVFLTAPGVNVRSTDYRGGYTLCTGTSFAVPQVSGAAAALLGIDAAMPPAAVRNILARTASDRGAEGYDEYYGYGILNLSACAELLKEAIVVDADTPCSFLPADGPAKRIRNNTDEAIACTYLLANYDAAGRCLGVKLWQLTILAHGTAAVEAPDAASRYGQFVCEAETLIPLAEAKKNDGIVPHLM